MWAWLIDAAAALVVLAALLGVALVLRRSYLLRHRGTFEAAVREQPQPSGGGWSLGIGRYDEDHVDWYRVFSLGLRPRHVFPRRELEIVARRRPECSELRTVLADAVVLECRAPHLAVELAMSPAVLTGFLAWLESSPPGLHLGAA